MRSITLFLIFFCFYFSSTQAVEWLNLFKPNVLTIEPEFYHSERVKKGGTKQTGFLFGGLAKIERMKRNSLYWGFEGQYAKGDFNGKTGAGRKIKSVLTESRIEGRIGYTLSCRKFFRLKLTPFIGIGYFSMTNHFKSPSPLPVHDHIFYNYVMAGFLSQIALSNRWNAGINFKCLYPYEPKCHVTHDPMLPNQKVKMLIGERLQLRIDLPITYDLCDPLGKWSIGFVPFYEYRNYDKWVNYPYNFIRTKFKTFGAGFEFIYHL